MIFVTNRPVESFSRELVCKLTAVPFSMAANHDLGANAVIVDKQATTGDCTSMQEYVSLANCNYIVGDIEFASGNTIVVIQDGQQDVLFLNIL